jgi:hypothetical protein
LEKFAFTPWVREGLIAFPALDYNLKILVPPVCLGLRQPKSGNTLTEFEKCVKALSW